jgi:hypothetical protein
MADEEQEVTETVTHEEQPDPAAALKSALQKERESRKAAEKSAKALEARLAALEEERTAASKGVTSDRLDEIRTLAEAKFKGDLEERDRLRQEVRALKLDGTVKGYLAKAEVVDADAAWKLFREEFDLTDDGKPIVASDPTADIEKYVMGTLREKHPYMFRGTQAGGSGARGSRGGASGAVRTIPFGDVGAFLANVDAIAKGEVEVR